VLHIKLAKPDIFFAKNFRGNGNKEGKIWKLTRRRRDKTHENWKISFIQ